MFNKKISLLLDKHISSLPLLICKRSLRHDIDDLTASILPGLKLAVIDDSQTGMAYGDEVFRALRGRFNAGHVTLPGMPTADSETVEYIRKSTVSYDALVAVGSGTINDVCKYAAFLGGKPYIVFPTAGSMNGYLSANASITVDGYKKTVAAQMPKAVFCDMSVIAAAPARLNKSGLGDCLARPTAQADWLLSHLFLGTPYNEVPFTLLEDIEPELLDNARGIAKSDPASLELLMHTLLLSGLGMTIAGGSYPASQGEHMVAHAVEMVLSAQCSALSKKDSPAKHYSLSTKHCLHGESIGITTLTIARMQENILNSPPPLWGRVREEGKFPDSYIMDFFGSKVHAEAKKAYHIKSALMAEKNLDPVLRLDNNWDTIATRIENIMIPSTRIHAILKAAEAPDTPEALGWTQENYATALTCARFLRERFTFLDLE